MKKAIVISQPYYFPWIGLLEQIRLADVFIHYDDVQFSKGHFQDRVQIKTLNGFNWLTVPKKNLKLGQKINEVLIDNRKNWKRSQLDFLTQVFRNAPFKVEMINLVKSVFCNEFKYLAEVSISSIMAVVDYYGLNISTSFNKSSPLTISGSSTERVINIVKYYNANFYITGMGALKYMDFTLFEKENITVEFMNYKCLPYPQLFGVFNPYVSSLDLIANTGKTGLEYICSGTTNWIDFVKSETAIHYLKGKTFSKDL